MRAKSRSIPPEVLCKKTIMKNFAELTGKPLCRSLFFNKIGRLVISLKKALAKLFFLSNFLEELIPKTPLNGYFRKCRLPLLFLSFIKNNIFPTKY